MMSTTNPFFHSVLWRRCLAHFAALAIACAALFSGSARAADHLSGVMGMRMVDIDGALHRIGGRSGAAPTVLVLLDTGCPVANRYAPELNDHFALAQKNGVAFFGVISDPLITPEEARIFRDERDLEYPLLFDASGDLALALQPSVVPQAFVLDRSGELVYSGRIDNRFVSVGRMRQVVTSHDLRDALNAISSGKPITNARTQSVGCVFEAWTDDLPEEVTYTQHIQPLLAANCMECHVEGGIAPFTLDTFKQAARRAGMMSLVAEERLMPPWPADPTYRRFRDERILTDRQIDLLTMWAKTGKARGEESHALPVQAIAGGWTLGEPDYVLSMEESYELPATGPDQYRRFVIKAPFDEPVVVTAIGFKPGDPEVVHHANFFYDESGEARKRDAADDGPGYDAFSGRDIENSYDWDPQGFGIGGWAPGTPGYQLPDGVGMLLPAGGDVVIEIHYHLTGKTTTDLSSLAIYTAKAPVENYADGLIMGSLDLDIRAGDDDYLRRIYMDVPVDMTLIDVFPHMHYIGTQVWAEATTPDGTKIPLIRINDWDFRWQSFYQFTEPIEIPAGSRIDAWFRYDNSAQNPDNPNNPPRDVTWGWQSTDEMLEIWLTVIYEGQINSALLQGAAVASFFRDANP